jgi:hypothetical protein
MFSPHGDVSRKETMNVSYYLHKVLFDVIVYLCSEKQISFS